MLGRFVCQAARLRELPPFRQLFEGGSPLALAVLGRGGATLHDFLTNLKADLDDLAAFSRRQGPSVRVEALEMRLPQELTRAPSADEVAACVSAASVVIGTRGGPDLTPYYEAAPGAAGARAGPGACSPCRRAPAAWSTCSTAR
jgi:hypothetical protein